MSKRDLIIKTHRENPEWYLKQIADAAGADVSYVSRVLSGVHVRPKRSGDDVKKNQVVEARRQNPDMSQADIARHVGCSQTLVSVTLNGDPPSKKYRSRYIEQLGEENVRWLRSEAEHIGGGATMWDVARGVITDARLGDL